MTQLQTTPTAPAHLNTQTRSLLLAAEAVLAHLHPRAPLRLAQVNFEGVAYVSAPDADALRLNRALAEEVVLVASAQAAGLPVLSSPSITQDVQVIPELFTIVPLAAGSRAWADAANRILSTEQLSREECLRRVESSNFSLNAGVSNLLALYSDITPMTHEVSTTLR